MKLKDKLFVVRNDQPHLNPIGVNIPAFAKLWDADTSIEKIEYAKELAYIYHMWEYDSPYYDRKNKEEEIIRDFIGKKNWKPTKRLTAALEAYAEFDNCAEKRLLDAAVASCDALARDLTRIRQDSKQLEKVVQEIDQEINNAEEIDRKIELLSNKISVQEKQLKVSTLLSRIMPQLESTIETTISLRKKVTTSVYKGESSDTLVGDFLYDKLMIEIDYEQNANPE